MDPKSSSYLVPNPVAVAIVFSMLLDIVYKSLYL